MAIHTHHLEHILGHSRVAQLALITLAIKLIFILFLTKTLWWLARSSSTNGF